MGYFVFSMWKTKRRVVILCCLVFQTKRSPLFAIHFQCLFLVSSCSGLFWPENMQRLLWKMMLFFLYFSGIARQVVSFSFPYMLLWLLSASLLLVYVYWICDAQVVPRKSLGCLLLLDFRNIFPFNCCSSSPGDPFDSSFSE